MSRGNTTRALAAAVLLAVSTSALAWKYKTDKDALTGKPIQEAEIRSSNSLKLSFPYRGPNRGWLTVRKHPQHGLDVYISIERGQIVCHHIHCTIRFRVGNGEATDVPASRASDGSNSTLFFSYPLEAVELFKAGKDIAIQLTIFHSGEHVLKFSAPAPLVWE